MGRRRAQAARLGRAGRLRDRAEDRRLARSRSSTRTAARPRRDARRRSARGGRHRQPAHDPRRSRCALAGTTRRRCSRCAARSTCRSRASARFNERAGRGRARRRRRTRATPPPARCASSTPRITAARPLSVWVYGTGYREGVAPDTHFETLAVAARARLPHEPVRRAARVDRGGREGLRGVGAAPRRARLRDRRHRDQGRLVRPAAAARRAARAAALGARLQVGADDGRDEAA